MGLGGDDKRPPSTSPPHGGLTSGPPPTRRHSSGGEDLATLTATLTLEGEMGGRQRTASGSSTLQYMGVQRVPPAHPLHLVPPNPPSPTRDQHILVGAEEGIYTLNLNQLHEAAMDQLWPSRTTWMLVVKSVLMTISGGAAKVGHAKVGQQRWVITSKGPYLYRHDLIALHSRHLHRFSLPMNKIPEKLIPRKYAITSKVADTKGTLRCCMARNPYNGYKYLCGATATYLYLMQWYDPLNKFMLLKTSECYLAHPLRVFELIITPDLEYPLVCVDVGRGAHPSPSGAHPSPSAAQSPSVTLSLIDLNTGCPWYPPEVYSEYNNGTLVPQRSLHDTHAPAAPVTSLTQIEKDAILVCYDDVVRVVDLKGRLKERKRQTSELVFDFNIDSIEIENGKPPPHGRGRYKDR
ncbi:mitogen-activated protein kinase kinase kinase kinase 3-like [Hyalella azteca]|uniref:Mitogen-activated protein kinase kinase kinase kinase 3-like n=1 Tax=Hyalella azteca TaxID=294128 RepID=A0A979FG26_HYAAZ|nr:mitogen-activated protein kinase kinase kinase kinase 3-like [Hyalella azteca]